MADENREEEIRKLKALRAELLSQYEGIEEKTDLNTEEAILLRQTLLEDYRENKNSSEMHYSDYVENDDSDNESEAPVKKLTRGRSM